MIKKLNKGISLLVLTISMLFNTTIVNAQILNYGDVDEDGNVSKHDANMVLEELTPIQTELANVVDDDKVTLNDGTAIAIISEGTTLLNSIKGSNNENVLSGNYEVTYDETCKAAYGEVEKCITGYNFSNSAAGLYSSEDDNGTTYYYRGNVTNNYVKLDGYDFLWRIVRINGDGSIRLVGENGIDNNAYYNYLSSAPTSVTDMKFDGSNAQNKLNTWYNENLYLSIEKGFDAVNDNQIENIDYPTNFCNRYNDENGGSIKRMSNPSFKCPLDSNIAENIKVGIGLLTADEVIFSGMSYEIGSSNSYLTTGSAESATMTSYYDVEYELYTFQGDNITSEELQLTQDILRPVINLNKDSKILYGTGTKDNPYVVDTKRKAVILNTVDEDKTNKITHEYKDYLVDYDSIEYRTYETATNDGSGEWKYTWIPVSRENIDLTPEKDTSTVININTLSDTDSETYNKIEYALRNTTDANPTYLQFQEEGDFGFDATIRLSENLLTSISETPYLYKWDGEKLVYVAELKYMDLPEYEAEFLSDINATNGIKFTEGGVYVITSTKLADSVLNPQTGMQEFILIAAISLFVVGAVGLLIYFRKRNKAIKI